MTNAKIKIDHILNCIFRVNAIRKIENGVGKNDAQRKAEDYQNCPLFISAQIFPCHSFLEIAGVSQGEFAVVLGHTTFLIGTVLPQVYTRLRQLDRNLEEAALDLGASPVQTFFHVVMPNIKTAIFGAALLSVTLSLDEIPVTFFLNGVFTTLPIKILAMTRNGFTPEINAICSLILVFSVSAVVVSNMFSKGGTYGKSTDSIKEHS